MRIKRVTAYAVELPLQVKYKMSVANREKLSTVVVEIHTRLDPSFLVKDWT